MTDISHPIKKLWPAEHSETRSVASLSGYKLNSRVHSAEQIKQIAASIQQWGWTIPILIDDTSTVIAGHARLEAAKLLGITDVPCIVATGWTDEQKRAYVIADNKLTTNGGWDEDILRDELKALGAAGFELPLLGFSDKELGVYLYADSSGLTDPDEIPEPPASPISQTGDIWTLGRHRLICGDATQPDVVASVLSGAVPGLMVTDPPYGVDYDPTWRRDAGVNKNPDKMGKVENDGRFDWTPAWKLFPGIVAYVWHAGIHTTDVATSLQAAGFNIRSQIIWAKDRFALSRGNYHWQHEPCWYAVKDGENAHWNGDRTQSTVWKIAAREDSGHTHGTQKPVECMRRPIENNSSIGQIVYDPFVGSGTTIIAAEMTGRCCYAVEIKPEYVDVCIKRWQAFTGKQAIHEASGKPFDQQQAA